MNNAMFPSDIFRTPIMQKFQTDDGIISKPKWNFNEEPLQKKLLAMEAMNSPALQKALHSNLTEDFISSLYYKATQKPPENINIEIKGQTRCLVGDTLILTEKGYKQIKDIKIGEQVWSYCSSPSRRYFALKPVLNTFKYKSIPTTKLTFQDGSELTGTKNHALFSPTCSKVKPHGKACNGKRIRCKLKEIDCFKINDTVLMPQDYPKIGLDFDHRLCRILGFLIGDGSLYLNESADRHKGYTSIKTGKYTVHTWKQKVKRVQFFNITPSTLKQYKEDFENYFNLPISTYIDKRTGVTILTSNNSIPFTELYSYMKVSGNKKSYSIKIPNLIFASSIESKRQFLRALFSTDAWISDKRAELEYVSTSKELIRGIRLLLLDFGIKSKISHRIRPTTNHHDVFRLTIKGYSNIKAFETIGFVSTKKQTNLNTVLSTTRPRSLKEFKWTNKIVEISDTGLQDVYDLEIAETHNYIAEGMLSHNSGKSTVGITIGMMISRWWGYEFTEDNILPNQGELQYKLRNAKYGETFLVDEQTPETYGEGVIRESEQLGTNLNICAKKCNNLIFIYPPSFTSRNSPFGLEALAKDVTNRYVKCFYYDLRRKEFGGGQIPRGYVLLPKFMDLKYKGLKQEKWSAPRLENWNEKHYDFDSALEEGYEGKKDLWIEDVRNMEAGVRDKKKTELAESLAIDDSFMSLKSNGQKEAYVQLLINKGKVIEMAKTEMKTVVDMALVLSQINMDE